MCVRICMLITYFLSQYNCIELPEEYLKNATKKYNESEELIKQLGALKGSLGPNGDAFHNEIITEFEVSSTLSFFLTPHFYLHKKNTIIIDTSYFIVYYLLSLCCP